MRGSKTLLISFIRKINRTIRKTALDSNTDETNLVVSISNSAMKKAILFSVIVMFINCAEAQELVSHSLYFEGEERHYAVYLPEGCEQEQNLPVVFAFHEQAEYWSSIFSYGNLSEVADAEKFIVCYPQGEVLYTLSHWNVGGHTIESEYNDIGFVNAVVNKLIEDYPVEPSRFYACGRGNGGFFSLRAACQLSHKFAAVASVGGSMTFDMMEECDPGRYVPVLQLHGDENDVVYYDEDDLFYSSAIGAVDYWVNHNECDPDPVVETLPDNNPNDGSVIKQYTYSGPTHCQQVVHYKVIGEDRDVWPGQIGNYDMEMAEVLWDFFSAYSVEDGVSCQAVNVDEPKVATSNVLQLYPIPSGNEVTVQRGVSIPTDYWVMDLSGKTVLQGVLPSATHTIDLSMLSPGVYVFSCDGLRRRFIIH